MSNKKGWPELGMIVKNVIPKEFDENNKPLRDGNGNIVPKLDDNGNVMYKVEFKLADDITILRGGEPVALNNRRTGMMKTPQQEVEGLYKAGQIDDGDIEERREKAKAAHSWCRYKVQLPPPRD